jgi:arylsulfatase A-like enzyme
VQHVDLFPTLLEALAIDPPESRHGRSLLPLLRGETGASWREAALVSLLDVEEGHLEAVTTEHWRLIRRRTTDGTIEELFRLADDPHEKRDLAAVERETAARLAAHLDAIPSRNAPFGEEPAPALLDRRLERRLRALGYL